jgi:hypothetical protein
VNWKGCVFPVANMQHSMSWVIAKISWNFLSIILKTSLFQSNLFSLIWGWFISRREEPGKSFLFPFIWLVNYGGVCHLVILTR